jgi:hypothetical protein
MGQVMTGIQATPERRGSAPEHLKRVPGAEELKQGGTVGIRLHWGQMAAASEHRHGKIRPG